MKLEDPVGKVRRPNPGEGRKRDRRVGLIYRVAERSVAPGSKRWSPAQSWALRNDVCVGEVLADTDANLPVLEWPGLTRLAQLTYASFALPGPVLIEAPVGGMDPLVKAVVASYVMEAGRELCIGPYTTSAKPVTARIQQNWVETAGRSRVAETVEDLKAVTEARILADGNLDAVVLELGFGRLRDVEFARHVAAERCEAGWSGRRVREYLELYGFQNSSGTIGRWPHEQFVRLLGRDS
jgi:hypothetical protein